MLPLSRTPRRLIKLITTMKPDRHLGGEGLRLGQRRGNGCDAGGNGYGNG